MASGNVLITFKARDNEPPASAYATPDTRNGILVLDFDAAAIEGAVFRDVLPDNYNGGGLTIDTYWMATSATSSDIKVGTSVERDNTANHDLDADAFATEQTATTTADATSGKVFKATTTHSAGANMDSAAAGDPIRLKVRRIANDAADTMTGDAELFMVVVKET